MEEEQEKNLFISDCIRLETFIDMYCQTGYSDREICSVLTTILKRVTDRQADPQGALEQVIETLKAK
jgi:hypothetical protein